MNRRAFLRLTASTAVIAPNLMGCSDEPLPNLVDATVTKGPWLTLLAPGVVRLRFETLQDVSIPVVVRVGGVRLLLRTTTETARVTWSWGFEAAPTPLDVAGEYTLHDVVISGVPVGATLDWELLTATPHTGSATPNPHRDDPLTLCWIADTMFPMSETTTAMAAAMAPDLVLHGGDLQYRDNPADTWAGLFQFMQPLMRTAPLQVCVGNHEFDAPEEVSELYDRLFSGQGGRDERWHAVTFGPLYIVMLDSESGDLDAPDGAQVAWADDAISRAVDQGLTPILAFHRPTYSLSKHWRANTALRDAVHGLATRHGVPLVLSGHVHGYERFVVDGIHYVVDGGGGALTYDLEEGLAEVEAVRPGESELRVAAEESYGCTRIVVQDGEVHVTRMNADDGVTDAFTFTLG